MCEQCYACSGFAKCTERYYIQMKMKEDEI